MASNATIKQILKTINIDEEVIIETEKGILVGQLQFVDNNCSFLKLSGVRNEHNFVYTSPQLIPVKKIKSIQSTTKESVDKGCSSATETSDKSDSTEVYYSPALKQPEEPKNISASHLDSTLDTSFCDAEESLPATVKNDSVFVELSPLELQLLQKQICSVKVLNCRGPDYDNAITDIKSQSYVALDIEPHFSGRNRKTAVVTIATVSSVYVFDIVMLGKIFEDIKTILKSERPSKALFNSHIIVDHFEHRQSLQINGISDVFVAYCIVTNQRRNMKLEEVVSNYFGISKEFFNKIDDSQMFARPINDDFVGYCAKRASLILKLNEYLHKSMLRTFFSQCKSFSRTFASNEDSCEVAMSMENRDNSGHQYIQQLNISDQSL